MGLWAYSDEKRETTCPPPPFLQWGEFLHFQESIKEIPSLCFFSPKNLHIAPVFSEVGEVYKERQKGEIKPYSLSTLSPDKHVNLIG